MLQIFNCANEYIKARDWKMLAVLKFCLCSIGVLIGLSVPEKHKKFVLGGALGVFFATYIPLMFDFVSFAIDFFRSVGNAEN